MTDVSGRGVGMDVVRPTSRRIGGAVSIESRLGQGTTLRVKIPLTLAIIPALIVESHAQRFAIPQVSLREIVTLQSGSADGIETIGTVPVYRLRGELLPLVVSDRGPADAAAGRRPSGGRPRSSCCRQWGIGSG